MPDALRDDSGIKLATNDLCDAFETALGTGATVVYRTNDGMLPEGDVVLISGVKETGNNTWKSKKSEGFRLRPVALQGRKAIAVEGDPAGLMYGTFKLSERVRLGDDPWKVRMEITPAFALRMFSEEGQLFNLPDIAYYIEQSPYVNEKRLQTEIDELKRLIDEVVKRGYNALTVLHVNFEDYIDYRHLDKRIYAEGDRHLVRSPVFCKYLTELADYAHKRHVQLFLQPYEYQYPPRLDELYGVNIDSPNLEKLVTAKVRELFERVPLDGLVITATETHPRCGYLAKKIWVPRGIAGAGHMATFYHNAAKAMNRKAIFRMWRVSFSEEDARKLGSCVPKDAMLATKNTGGDYFLNWTTTKIISGGWPKQHPTMVLFDTFREYEGWSRLFIYMKRWGEVVRICQENGVKAINGWGPWTPTCICSDHDGRISWSNDFDTFRTLTRGFTPGQANVYLLGRLSWDPQADVEAIAHDFAALHLGTVNARAAVEALMATEDAFDGLYLGTKLSVTHPCYLSLAMVFRGDPVLLERAYGKVSLQQVLDITGRGLGNIEAMEKAFAKTDASQAPNKKWYAQFKVGIEKTALYLRTLYLWRECWWRHRADRELQGDAKAANAAALQKSKARLSRLFDVWSRFPEEAGAWQITYRYGRPPAYSNPALPHFFMKDRTMESAAAEF
ncbi:MAG: hypothetical protein JXM70_25385 [Pirellulales bacterium]|nr:hypothetical protein [Pirellulales bacterium]